jgi:acetyl esterase/lipase
MPIGYLLTAVLVAWCTLMALAPPRRPLPIGFMAYIYGYVPSELPFLACYYLVASTMLAAAQTGLNSPAGWAGVTVASIALLELILVIARARPTGPVLDRALAEGLGPGVVQRRGRRLGYGRIVFAPFYMRRAGVERLANISYGDAGQRNRLDIYRQRSHPANAPVFVHFHGGMLIRGKKNREALPLLYQLASEGWLCISANYRLRPRAHFPEHLIDIKKVIAWVRQHGTGYGADAGTLVLSGTSSGGQLAALAAFTAGDRRYQPGFEEVDTSVSAVVYLSGFYGFPGAPWSPLASDATNAPPFFIIHGDKDSVVPVEYARLFAAKLRRESPSPVVYAELPGAQHSFERFHSIRLDTVVDAVETFTTWLSSHPHPAPAPPPAAPSHDRGQNLVKYDSFWPRS